MQHLALIKRVTLTLILLAGVAQTAQAMQTTVYTSTAGSPLNNYSDGGSGVGLDTMSAMNNACADFRDDSWYVEETQEPRCWVQDDGLRYTCRDATSVNNFCAGYTLRDCAQGSARHNACYVLPMKDLCVVENLQGNPCNVATGNKLTIEPIFGRGPLGLTLHYNSQNYSNERTFGHGWSSSLHKKLTLITDSQLSLTRPSGRIELFENDGSHWISDADIKRQITETQAGLFVVTNGDGSQETYNLAVAPFIISEVSAQGETEKVGSKKWGQSELFSL